MPDIAMCQNKACSLKDTCYRFIATPSYRQSYMLFYEDNSKCDHYWKCKSLSVKRRLDIQHDC